MTTFNDWLRRSPSTAAGQLRAVTDRRWPRRGRKLRIFLAWAGQHPDLRRAVKAAHRAWRRTRRAAR